MRAKKQKFNPQIKSDANVRYPVYFVILSLGILLLFMIFMPYLADYYLLQPDINIFEYYNQHALDQYYDFEALLINLFMFAVLCFTRHTGVAMFAAALPVMILAYVSSIKYAARNELFRFDDLKLTEAAEMAVHYLDFKFTAKQLSAIAMVLSFCIAGGILDRLRKRYPVECLRKIWQKPITARLRVLAGVACLGVMVCYAYQYIESKNTILEIDSGDVFGVGNDRYVLYNFLKNDKYASITADNVSDSYRYIADNIQTSSGQANDSQRPDVIVIMNESWWNTDNVRAADIFSSDPMRIYKELSQKCSTGYLSTNIFGGGTISSEAEFLTGINTKHLTSDIGIYSELAERKVPSIVDYFHALDYKATFIHPYYGEYYDRDKIYSIMDFDKVIFDDDMDYTDIYTKYISDESLVKQIIKEYEESGDSPSFIFAVSIANHIRRLGYKTKSVNDYDYPISVTIDKSSFRPEYYDDFVNYINGIYLANEAFSQIVSYFEKQDRPVVIVMYGDHCPSFSSEIMDAMGISGTDYEALKRQYSVPVIMWSNFNDEKVEFTGENINYLPQMLLEYAGLPETEMTRILNCERSVFKADTRRFIQDGDGGLIENYSDKQNEAARHFKVLDYDILYGNSAYREKVWLP